MESVIFLLHWPALRGQQCLSCGYTVPSKTIRTSSWCWTIALAAILPTRSDPTSVDTLPAPSADTCPSLCSAVTHPQLSMFVRLSPSAVAFYAAEVILALEELHRQGILYRSVRTTQPACTRPSRGYGQFAGSRQQRVHRKIWVLRSYRLHSKPVGAGPR